MVVENIIVGLGNLGEQYINTRHNLGWMALDYISDGKPWESSKSANAHYMHLNMVGVPVELIKPKTYMNNSGLSVRYAIKKHSIGASNIIVVHDDMDLPIGTIKISYARGSGGHKGVQSVIDQLGTDKFVRVRVGIAPKNIFGKIKKTRGMRSAESFVLKRFTKREVGKIENILPDIKMAIETILKEGRERAMNMFN